MVVSILSRACEIKHCSAEEGCSAKGEAVHSLCSIHCAGVLQLPHTGTWGWCMEGLLTGNISFGLFQCILKGRLHLQASYTSWHCQLLQWFPGLESHAGSLFFSPVVSCAASSPAWGRSGDNLALAPLPLAVLSGVLHVVVISSKPLEVMLLPGDLSGVLYKEIVLLKAWPKNLSGNTGKRARKKWLILSLVKAKPRSSPLGLLLPCYLGK